VCVSLSLSFSLSATQIRAFRLLGFAAKSSTKFSQQIYKSNKRNLPLSLSHSHSFAHYYSRLNSHWKIMSYITGVKKVTKSTTPDLKLPRRRYLNFWHIWVYCVCVCVWKVPIISCECIGCLSVFVSGKVSCECIGYCLCMSGRFRVRVCIGWCLSVCVCGGRFHVESVCALGVSVCVCGKVFIWECVCIGFVFVPVFNVHKIFCFHFMWMCVLGAWHYYYSRHMNKTSTWVPT
jgi:hypothetical protein